MSQPDSAADSQVSSGPPVGQESLFVIKTEKWGENILEYRTKSNIDPQCARSMCRCCLAEGVFESLDNISSSSGLTESYAEILSTTLGLALLSTRDPRLSGICGPCASQLRQAFAFRKQVVAAEKSFLAQHELDIKVEPRNAADFSSDETITAATHKPNYINTDFEIDKIENDFDDDFNEDIPLNTIPLGKRRSKASIDYENDDYEDMMNDNVYGDNKFNKCTYCDERHASDDYLRCALCEHVFLNLRDKVYHAKCDPYKCSFCNDFFCKGSFKGDKHNHHMKYCKYIICLRKRLLNSIASGIQFKDPAGTEEIKAESIKFLTGRLYSCDICKINHSFEEVKRTHKDYQKFTCTLCKVVFSDENKKGHHLKNHDIHCYVCDTTLPTPEKRRSHIASKHGFKCTICGDRFLGQQRIHDVEFHGARSFSCGICMISFPTDKKLSNHQRMVHMKEKNVRCPKCDLDFFNESRLRKHMVVHDKAQKDYQCEYCSKKFLRKSTLQCHVRIHTGDKRAVCKICGEAFVQRASLKYHLEKYHPGDFY